MSNGTIQINLSSDLQLRVLHLKLLAERPSSVTVHLLLIIEFALVVRCKFNPVLDSEDQIGVRDKVSSKNNSDIL